MSSFLCSSWLVIDSSFIFQPLLHELYVCKGCVLWGNRVIIPKAEHQTILDELHDFHKGASCMKERA